MSSDILSSYPLGKEQAAKTSIRPPVQGSLDERCAPRRTAPVGNRRSRPETGPDSKDFGEFVHPATVMPFDDKSLPSELLVNPFKLL